MPATADSFPWISLLTLTGMEIVLGVDNIVFIAILVARVSAAKRERIRRTGIALALAIRIGLLFTLSWLMQLTAPSFMVAGNELSGRDLILIAGGLFLVAKAAHEMHNKLEGKESQGLDYFREHGFRVKPFPRLQGRAPDPPPRHRLLARSVITAVGMASQLWVMITAMVLSVVVMLVSAGAIGDFVERHPTVKILALSFLLLIGVVLIAEGFHQHISKGYIYFAMAFALAVEFLNMRLRKVQEPVRLRAGTERTAASGMAGSGSS
jgi:predicted tellurium resistance membrane protein TerC